MKLIIHFKHGGCSIVHSEDKEEAMKIFNKFKRVNFNRRGNYVSANVVIPYNEIKFVELQGD
ncbi:hypothetical protein CN931_08730 [Bacillus sp. AFS054943]|uniref:Uncharacterized protein n=1 Tax=Bacillus cereus TaxID=1396 RepID=A0A2C1LLV0_BACCE|nr:MULTISPECIES: hypothetical protein [Bacillus]PGL85681.1 hypothetical protein CN931_08730 [Bacillus sp. AFS054943]PGT99457.1 hypothetical protein COD19_19245 [Bacillus cereus]